MKAFTIIFWSAILTVDFTYAIHQGLTSSGILAGFVVGLSVYRLHTIFGSGGKS